MTAEASICIGFSLPKAGYVSLQAPDQKLFELARASKLKSNFRKEVSRWLDKHRKTFIADFTTQWLDTDVLKTLMPDRKIIKGFRPHYTEGMVNEVRKSFDEILMENRPVHDFIDPDFIYTSGDIGKNIYKLPKPPKAKGAAVQKVAIERGTRQGGLLSMPAVMMATANGVDTQPVLRGVWMLENILGMPTGSKFSSTKPMGSMSS